MAADADLLLDGRLVLLVDDDPTVLEVCRSYLEQAGFRVAEAADAFTALERVERERPDLVVLDRMLPGLDGIEVCRRIRASSAVPIIMLTALGAEDDRIAGLEAGVDDYLAKPFSPRELTLRVRTVLRRALAVETVGAVTAGTPSAVIERGPLRIDVGARTVDLGGRRLGLTQREFELLTFLARRPGTVFSREDLLAGVWGWSHGDLSTVTVHVRRLREKIETDAADPRLLVTVWGYGYRFDPPEDAS
ncbi:Transcriptional regulatory protein SrrA [Agromyces sp. NDB4Y10]|uniref:response regulator transcription factor n=1 Tax=Agromyces sp. NDB4Y10 TaxID=1775951 RepID=UPI0007B27100|nr:response regulator transcription factor [Agromyces sp. NDB4Y10]KZE92477.1 Transcriptional regulatory protein SrrA [Agromyces sp. NDB4Y10]